MDGSPEGSRFSGPAIRVATAAVALGMVVMIVSVAVGLGFKREIRDKIVGFGSHVQITGYSLNSSFETPPLPYDSMLVAEVSCVPGVKGLQPYVTKPGIIKTDDAFQGIALKGVDSSFNWSFINSCLVEGHSLALPDSAKSDDILLSRSLANLLGLSLGDPVRMFFVNAYGVRARRFNICGIFDSHFDEFDKSLAYVDMRHLVQLNDWKPGTISGYEVLLHNFDMMDDVTNALSSIATTHVSSDEAIIRVSDIRRLQPQIFGWLALLDQNILVIIVLIIAVAGLNMVSGLLILILEHTNAIGIFKAVGASNSLLRNVFILMALRIVGKGLLFGNVIGVGLCLIQKFMGVVSLDPENYYLDTVPVLLSVPHLLLLNLGTALLAFLLLLGPSGMVARISPVKAIRFN